MADSLESTLSSASSRLLRESDRLLHLGDREIKLNDVEKPIEPGDVIFVPAGEIHGIRNLDNDDPLTVVFFMDSPELVDLFRAIHEQVVSEPDRPITAEEVAEFEKEAGGGKSIK